MQVLLTEKIPNGSFRSCFVYIVEVICNRLQAPRTASAGPIKRRLQLTQQSYAPATGLKLDDSQS